MKRRKKCEKLEPKLLLDTTNLITGLPRTGKTYSVVYTLAALESKYSIYSNITNIKIGESYNIKKLESDLNVLHSFYLSVLSDPSKDEFFELKKKQKELNFFVPKDGKNESILVIDEALNFFSKSNPSFVFLLSYASRFNLRVLLIAQSVDNLHKDFKGLIVNFYNVVNLNRRFSSSSFYVKVYGNAKDLAAKKESVETLKIPICQNVFALYSTPNYKGKSKNVFIKLFFFLFVAVFLAVFLFGFSLFGFFNSSDPDVIVNKKNNVVNVVKKRTKKIDSVVYTFKCFSDFCFLMTPDLISKNQKTFDSYGVVLALTRESFDFDVKHKKIKVYQKKGGEYYVKVKNLQKLLHHFVYISVNR